MRNKTYEVVVSWTILPTFRDTVCKDIVLLHPYILFFDKDFVVKFFVGSFTVKTTRRLNNYCKSHRNFWQVCSTSMNTDGKHNNYLSLIHDSNMAKIFPTSQACIYYYTNERL